jgi:hypothetical protein
VNTGSAPEYTPPPCAASVTACHAMPTLARQCAVTAPTGVPEIVTLTGVVWLGGVIAGGVALTASYPGRQAADEFVMSCADTGWKAVSTLPMPPAHVWQ